jgi:hypothetical protein
MGRTGILFFFIVGLWTQLLCADHKNEPTTKSMVKSFAGCYELTSGKGENLGTPKRIQLLTTRDRRAFKDLKRDCMVIRPISETPGPTEGMGMFHAYWGLKDQQGGISLVWTNGFSGIDISLKPENGSLVGNAHMFWDFSGPSDLGRVVAHRIPCQ